MSADRSGPVRLSLAQLTIADANPLQLIDAADCRGLRLGDAQVSEMHCNFLINLGGATAADIETLGETVRKRVKENSGVELDWEIKRIGVEAGA